MRFSYLVALTSAIGLSSACDDCYGPQKNVAPLRNIRRMQPEAQMATTQPRAPLQWGQLNVIHSTDTHGWLEGHLKEQNYGADWGDFVSFTRDMKSKAANLGVDLLLIDTGDLHDGNGLSDATSPDGAISNLIFEKVNYDLLTIGNHELYITEIAYETKNQFSAFYGEKYITSNVQILNPSTGHFEYIGQQYRYFTTDHGLRIMAFGVLYDFTGNSNVSKVTTTADLVKQSWFLNAVNYPKPIDLFLVIGHNPIRPGTEESTFDTLYSTIRGLRPNIPIQIFGGHSHIRDFVVFDTMSTGLESGRYCETLGFLSLSGINSTTFNGTMNPRGVPNPTQRAVKISTPTNTTSNSTGNLSSPIAASNSTSTFMTKPTPPSTGKSAPSATAKPSNMTSNMVYSRRYLDWNRLTFAYHAAGSQDKTFDTSAGQAVTAEITQDRKNLNLSALYGCAPQTYCFSCQPFGAPGNIFSLVPVALAATVVNQSRANIPRLIIVNTGGIRFDLVKGPFTYDDSFIVSPFTDGFQFIPSVPYATASKLLPVLNSALFSKRDLQTRDLQTRDFGFNSATGDVCLDTMPDAHPGLKRRSSPLTRGQHRSLGRRQTAALTPGYVTTDDFGIDGDDSPHRPIPVYPQPNDVQANASFPADGSLPATVDLVFLDYIAPDVITALGDVGAKEYTINDVSYYLPKTFTTQNYLPLYAQKYWQANVPNCPVGQGVGYPNKL